MKKTLLFTLLVIVGLFLYSNFSDRLLPFMRQVTNQSKQSGYSTLRIKDHEFRIEIADSAAEQAQGLSGRTLLDKDAGMLFLMSSRDQHVFWMKDMQFPLDIIWIDGDTIADISADVPVPLTETYIPRIQPKSPVDRVLEINAGEAKRRGINSGDKVEYSLVEEETL